MRSIGVGKRSCEKHRGGERSCEKHMGVGNGHVRSIWGLGKGHVITDVSCSIAVRGSSQSSFPIHDEQWGLDLGPVGGPCALQGRYHPAAVL